MLCLSSRIAGHWMLDLEKIGIRESLLYSYQEYFLLIRGTSALNKPSGENPASNASSGRKTSWSSGSAVLKILVLCFVDSWLQIQLQSTARFFQRSIPCSVRSFKGRMNSKIDRGSTSTESTKFQISGESGPGKPRVNIRLILLLLLIQLTSATQEDWYH